LEFAKTTYERWRNSPKGVVSAQETTAKKGDFDSATARLNASLADVNVAQDEVDRLGALEGFKRVIAPFDGVVTERNTDVGALINAGSGVGGGSGPVLFRVADVHKMRIFVQVPQRMSADIREGQKADLHLPQFPDKSFDATVATTARAINQSARTLLVELHANNPDGVLQPGSYTEVHFNLPPDPNILSVPTNTLIFRQNGLEVAVIGEDDRIVVKKISIGRNLGSRVEVLNGLAPSDRVVISPPDSLAAGDLVRIAGQASPSGERAGARADAEKNLAPDAKATERTQ
jgi:RND family efflux transporter MFP subunit